MRVVGKAVAAFCLLAASMLANAGVISVAVGNSIVGYLPLAIFGIAPTSMGNEDLVNIDVPSFRYAGEAWNRVGVTSNGYLVIGGGTAADVSSLNTNFPNSGAPNNVLAPFWTDLDPSAGGGVRIYHPVSDGAFRWLVVDWAGIPNASNPAVVNSFQVWIGLNAIEDITFVYDTIGTGNDGLATIGAEDKTGTVGSTYYFNGTGTLPASGTALRVTTRDLPVAAAVPEPASAALILLGLAGLALTRRRRGQAEHLRR